MKRIYKNLPFIVVFATLAHAFTACHDFLEERPFKTVIVPSDLADLQALLDNHNYMQLSSPDILELLSDNIYAFQTHWLSASDEQRLNYIWDSEAVSATTWNTSYQLPIYYSNVVLDQLGYMERTTANGRDYDQIRGSALFHRALAFQQLAQMYCLPYSAFAANEPGLPIRLTASIEEKTTRSTVEETYLQIIQDLNRAAELLPDEPQFPTRPSKAAAYGLLARTYLSMRDYEHASEYASRYLQIHSELMDYNGIADSEAPFRRFNKETIFYNNSIGFMALLGSRGKIDSVLYQSYGNNDLRKMLYFQVNTGTNAGSWKFKGNYDGDLAPGRPFVGGIATDEIYLIRAESQARLGDKESALKDLNTLMVNRWKNDGSFLPFTAVSTEGALNQILQERRKELVYRGLRWGDLRRLNMEGANITLTRKLGDQEFTLPPNDPRWTLLIPWEVINRSGIVQNRR